MLSSSLFKERKATVVCVCVCILTDSQLSDFPRPGEQASAEVNGKIVDHA